MSKDGSIPKGSVGSWIKSDRSSFPEKSGCNALQPKKKYMKRDYPINSELLARYIADAMRENRLSSCLLEVQAWASQGDVVAIIALSRVYFFGADGVKTNYVEAKRWLERVDPGEDTTGYASHLLGLTHYKGLGTSVDRSKAFRYFRRATLRGNHLSKLMVAKMLSAGDGTRRKPKAAKVLFNFLARDKRFNRVMRLNLALHSCFS